MFNHVIDRTANRQERYVTSMPDQTSEEELCNKSHGCLARSVSTLDISEYHEPNAITIWTSSVQEVGQPWQAPPQN